MQEDVFGIKSLLDKEEFEKVYRATGIDVDGRLEFLKKIFSHRERSLMKFITFAKCLEGFNALSMNDKINLVKRELRTSLDSSCYLDFCNVVNIKDRIFIVICIVYCGNIIAFDGSVVVWLFSK